MIANELSDLPNGWVSTTLGEVVRINPRDMNFKSLSSELPVTFVPMAAVEAEAGRISNPETMPLEKARKGHTQFKENDVIFARITPSMENGKAAIARNLANGLGFGSTEFHVLRPDGAVLPEFLFYFVRQLTFRNEAAGHMTSTVGQLRVPAEFMRKVSFPIAPIQEQERIVAKIGGLFSELRTAKQAFQEITYIMKQFRQSVLEKAFRGELTQADPNDELAEEFLERITADRQSRVRDYPDQEQQSHDRILYDLPDILVTSLHKIEINWEVKKDSNQEK